MHRFDGTSCGELLAPEKQECTATTSRPSRHPPRTHRYGANTGPGPSRCRLPFEIEPVEVGASGRAQCHSALTKTLGRVSVSP
jgi:hypothetical protein